MVVDGDGEDLLRLVLPDHVLVERLLDLAGGGDGAALFLRVFAALGGGRGAGADAELAENRDEEPAEALVGVGQGLQRGDRLQFIVREALVAELVAPGERGET